MSDLDFFHLIKTNNLVCVFVYDDYSLVSKFQRNELFRLENYFKNVKFVELNKIENKELLKDYNILKSPTIILFKNGYYCEKINGFKDSLFIKETINKYLR